MKEFSNRPPRAGKPRFSRGPRTEEVRAPKRPTLDITLAQAFTDMGLATELVQACGFKAEGLFVMDGSRRSANQGARGRYSALIESWR